MRLTLFPCLSTVSDCSTFPVLCGLPGEEGWFIPPDEGLDFLAWPLFGALWSCSFSSVVRVITGGGISLICCCSDIVDTALGGNGSRPITEPDPEAATHKIHTFQTIYHHNLSPAYLIIISQLHVLHRIVLEDEFKIMLQEVTVAYFTILCKDLLVRTEGKLQSHGRKMYL